MRAGMLLEALASRFAVELVVVPVSGPAIEWSWAGSLARSVTIVPPVDASTAAGHLTRQLADATLRARFEQTAPLPARVIEAPPTLAEGVSRELAGRSRRPLAVLVLRGYLAPFGCTLASRLAADRVVVDLDDDDELFARSIGAHEEADAIARVARVWLPDVDLVCVAAEGEARAIAARYGLRAVVTLPNAVRPPLAAPAPPPGEGRLLFVGNLTYGPNVEAARVLVNEILPIVQRDHPGVSVDLVGRHAGTRSSAADVRVHGSVADLEPHYRAADLVVAPLRHGGGTRIKVLEAFAHERPVVATPVAVSGLAVRDGHDLLLGESPAELAHAITALLDDRQLGRRLAEQAARTLADRYVQNVVAPLICDLVAGAPIDSA
jgi:glycosyltransferase involved in cell wall biosynthesis